MLFTGNINHIVVLSSDNKTTSIRVSQDTFCTDLSKQFQTYNSYIISTIK